MNHGAGGAVVATCVLDAVAACADDRADLHAGLPQSAQASERRRRRVLRPLVLCHGSAKSWTRNCQRMLIGPLVWAASPPGLRHVRQPEPQGVPGPERQWTLRR